MSFGTHFTAHLFCKSLYKTLPRNILIVVSVMFLAQPSFGRETNLTNNSFWVEFQRVAKKLDNNKQLTSDEVSVYNAAKAIQISIKARIKNKKSNPKSLSYALTNLPDSLWTSAVNFKVGLNAGTNQFNQLNKTLNTIATQNKLLNLEKNLAPRHRALIDIIKATDIAYYENNKEDLLNNPKTAKEKLKEGLLNNPDNIIAIARMDARRVNRGGKSIVDILKGYDDRNDLSDAIGIYANSDDARKGKNNVQLQTVVDLKSRLDKSTKNYRNTTESLKTNTRYENIDGNNFRVDYVSDSNGKITKRVVYQKDSTTSTYTPNNPNLTYKKFVATEDKNKLALFIDPSAAKSAGTSASGTPIVGRVIDNPTGWTSVTGTPIALAKGETVVQKNGDLAIKDSAGQIRPLILKQPVPTEKNTPELVRKTPVTLKALKSNAKLAKKIERTLQRNRIAEDNAIKGKSGVLLSEQEINEIEQKANDRARSRIIKQEDYSIESKARSLGADADRCRYSASVGLADCDTTQGVMDGARAFNRVGTAVIGFGTQIRGSQALSNVANSRSASTTYRESAKTQEFTAKARAIQGIGDMAMAMWQNKRKRKHIRAKRKASETAGIARGIIRSKKDGTVSIKGKDGNQRFNKLSIEAGSTGRGQEKESEGYVTARGNGQAGEMAKQIINKYKLNEDAYQALPSIGFNMEGNRITKHNDCKKLTVAAVRIQCERRLIAAQAYRNQMYQRKKRGIISNVEDVAGRAASEQKRYESRADSGMWGSIFQGVQNMATSAFGFLSAKELRKSASALETAERNYRDNQPDFRGDKLPGKGNSSRGFNLKEAKSSALSAITEEIDDFENDPNLDLGDPFDPDGWNKDVPDTPIPGSFNPANGNARTGGGGTQALGSGQTSPAMPSSNENAQARYAGDLEKNKTGYVVGGAAGGGYRGGGAGGGDGDSDGGFDFSQFAKLIPGLNNEESDEERDYRLNFGGDRNVAEIDGAYVLDRDSDLFEQINTRYGVVYKQGRVGE